MRVVGALGLAAALTATLLAGCKTVGPTYRGAPAAAVINKPTATGPLMGAAERGVSSEPLPPHWWRLYNNPRLDELVTQALAANTDLRVASANIARAEALLREADDERIPRVNLSAQTGYGQLSAEQYLLTQPLAPGGSYDVGASVAYQVDLFGQIRRGIEAGRADVQAAQAAYDLSRVTVAAQTAQAFADACSAGHELAAARRSLQLQIQSVALTTRLIRAGRGTALELTRSQSQVEQFRANIPALQAQQRTALFRLAVLTGRPPAEYPRDLETCSDPPRLTTPIPVGDGAALLRRRPDIRQAERQLAAATARIGVATADLYPRVGFGASVGSTGSTRDILGPATFRWALGPLVQWSFPNRSLARARIAGAEATTQAALARFDGVVLNALRETESALTVYARDQDRLDSLRAARAQAATALAQVERLHAAGREGYLPVLDAQRTLASVEQGVAAAEDRLSTDQVNVFLALGGGWAP